MRKRSMDYKVSYAIDGSITAERQIVSYVASNRSLQNYDN